MRSLPFVYFAAFLFSATSLLAGPREDWRTLYFPDTVTNAALQSSVWGDDADPDHDGFNNLFEYATGLNPTNFDAVNGLAFSRSNGSFSLSYSQRTNDDQLFFKVDFSTNLLAWNTPNDWTQTNLAAGPGFQLTTVKGLAPSSTAYFRLRVAGLRPTAIATNVTLLEDTPTVIQLSASDPDAGTNVPRFVVTQLPQKGALFDGADTNILISSTNTHIADAQGRVFYIPAPDTNGMDALAFKVVRNWVESKAATATLNITPVDDAPVAIPEPVNMMEDTSAYITLGGTDVDGDVLVATIRLLPTNGKLFQVLADGITLGPQITNTFTEVSNPNKLVCYVPNPGFFQEPVGDLIRYDLFDGLEFSNTVTVIIAVASDNDPPEETPGTNTGFIHDSVMVILLNVFDPDSDDFDGYITSLPAKGTLYFRGNLTPQNMVTLTNNHFAGASGTELQYVPNEPANGSATNYTFTYYVTEVNPVTLSNYVSPTITNTIVLLVGNLPPTLQGCQTNATTPPNTPVEIVLNGMDPDGDSSALQWTILGPPQNGTLAAMDIIGNFETITAYPFTMPSSDPSFGWPVQYTPAPGFGVGSVKTNSFAFTVQDQGGAFAPGNHSVVITVGP